MISANYVFKLLWVLSHGNEGNPRMQEFILDILYVKSPNQKYELIFQLQSSTQQI